ncbi:asparaginase [Corynebacterium sp. ES2794-CONJ1]|uniref:asparaginase n=1 Tax=Corynebacterium sp. ES2794-CONJ1 TaxID=2980553 RepID=UPI00398607C5
MSMSSPTLPKIVVVTTGGTIASVAHAGGARHPEITGEKLIAPIRQRFHDQCTFEVRSIGVIDSSAMTFATIDTIVTACHEALRDPTVTGVIVTHGTDSMEETAIALDTFHTDARPIVVTGSQEPFDSEHYDGYDNLADAVIVALDSSARNIGVLVTFGRAVLAARGMMKWHTRDFLGFATNAPEEPERAEPVPVVPLEDIRVDIIYAYPGAPRTLVDAALAAGANGLVVEAMGAGNVGAEMAAALIDAREKNIPVVISTRVPRGEVKALYGGAGGGSTLKAHGVVGSRYFRSAQARVLLAIAIASGRVPETLF